MWQDKLNTTASNPPQNTIKLIVITDEMDSYVNKDDNNHK